MKEKKLTNDEIVKALDICYNDVHCSVDCPYFNLNGRNFCQDKELYKDLKRIVLEHSEQKAEIERLTEENAELQKQVDELTDKLGKVLSGIKADELLVAKGIEQAVKDTAKEIFEKVFELNDNTRADIMYFEIEELAKQYGVEVE